MRAADLPGRLPQASSGRRSAALQLLPFDCLHALTPFPRKSHRLPFKNRERMPPPNLPLTTVAGHDPIYPYNPLCSVWSFGNERATGTPRESNNPIIRLLRKTQLVVLFGCRPDLSDVHLPYIAVWTADDNHSPKNDVSAFKEEL